jgi:hypothetical protein
MPFYEGIISNEKQLKISKNIKNPFKFLRLNLKNKK